MLTFGDVTMDLKLPLSVAYCYLQQNSNDKSVPKNSFYSL